MITERTLRNWRADALNDIQAPLIEVDLKDPESLNIAVVKVREVNSRIPPSDPGTPRPSTNEKEVTMKVHLRADSANGVHTRFTVFINGAHCGQLCMREEEAIFFHHIVLMSKYEITGVDEVISTGRWTKEDDSISGDTQ